MTPHRSETGRRPWAPLLIGALAFGLAACAEDNSAAPGGGDAGGTGGTDGSGPECTSTCEVEGGAECRAPGVRTCADTNGDGCLEWTAVTACEPGWSCVGGQCVNCRNDCETGSAQCGPGGGLQSCVASGDDDPCFEWGAEQPCPAGQSCSASQCQVGCTDECGEGAKRCSGNTLQTCARGPSGCLQWGQGVDCPSGQSCSIDRCAEGCADECDAASQRCRPGGAETCGNFDDDDCLEWSGVVPCPEDEVCSQGRCTKNCEEECAPEGDRQCSGNGFQICGNTDGDECLEWGPEQPCGEGEACSGGRCRAACVDECGEGSVQCNGPGVERCGNFDNDPCLEWSEIVACDMGLSCSNGECRPQCANECGELNQRQCSGNGFQICGNHDADPCLEWGVVNACQSGRVCANGECADRCVNECGADTVQCAGNGVQRCGNFDGDECQEWSRITPCPEGQNCSNGACAAVCGDECLRGATRCAPGGVQACGDFDEDACTDWGPAAGCPEGQFCSNGECAARCNDECARGARRCSLNGFQICGEYDNDPCVEWGGSTPCVDGQVCSNGRCSARCVDECAINTVQCSGNGTQICGNFDNDECREWSDIISCPGGTTCSNGVCTAFCRDECQAGATQCGGAGVQGCANFDLDNCLEWGPGVPCPDNQVCANGRCAAQCAHECDVGVTRCRAGGVQSCGNFDDDDCREWSAVAPCRNGEVCADGACAPFQPDCQDDGDCGPGLICQFGSCVPANVCRADADCAAGEFCDLLARVCRAAAPSGIGNACADDGGCAEGLICLGPELGGYCTQGCNADVICPVGSGCYQIDPEDDQNGACLRDCAGDAGCEDVHACYPAAGPLGGVCYFSQCEQDADCGDDPLIAARCDAGLCVSDNLCDIITGEGCADGQICVQYEGQGLCLFECGVFSDPCPDGLHCIAGGGDENGFCQPTGDTAIGGACQRHTECGADAMCIDDGLGNNRCRRICNTDASDCPNDDACLSVSGNVGVCLADCQSECNAGDMRCQGAAVQTCTQLDEDICLEWGVAVPCGGGQGCNGIEALCEPACRNDADCAHPIIPTRCNAGSCEVNSQCNAATGEGCQPPEECFLASVDGRAGVCLEVCDPVGDPCSVAGESCGLFGASAWCITPGDTAAGGECEGTPDCAAGSACFNLPGGVSRCLQLCNAEAGDGCPANMACADAGIDGRVGACIEACEDACAEGSVQCGANGGQETCGYFDGSLCLGWGAEEACPGGTLCDPETNECAFFCQQNADCPQDQGIRWACVEGSCVAPQCAVGDNDCQPDRNDDLCVPQDAFEAGDPGDPGWCLNTCDPLAPELCGEQATCDWIPVSDEAAGFVCLPNTGVLGEFETCGGANGACGRGLACLTAFVDANDEPFAACVFYCDTQNGNNDCPAERDCLEVPFFPGTVGFCAPQQ